MPSPSTAVALRDQNQPAALQDPQLMSALDAMLPTPAARQRFLRVAAQAFTREPKLRDCTQSSVVTAIVDALTWGLEPSGRVGGAYLVPFRDRDRNVLEAVMIPDYRGLIQIITKPGSPVTALAATLVHEGDVFTDYREGVDGYVSHRPSLASDRSRKPTTHAYATAALATGERIVRVIDRSYAEKIASRSKSSRSPWQTDFDAMFRKTAIKALANNLPVAREVRELIAREDVLEGEARDQPALEAPRPTGPTAAARLGQRLRQERLPSEPPVDEVADGEFIEQPGHDAGGAAGGDPAGDNAGGLTWQQFRQRMASANLTTGRVKTAAGELWPDRGLSGLPSEWQLAGEDWAALSTHLGI